MEQAFMLAMLVLTWVIVLSILGVILAKAYGSFVECRDNRQKLAIREYGVREAKARTEQYELENEKYRLSNEQQRIANEVARQRMMDNLPRNS